MIMKALWLVLPLISSVRSQTSCRCLAGDQCWPSDSDFSILAGQVSQPLLYPKPPAAACYPTSKPSGNCSEVTDNARNGNWRSGQPGSMQSPNFETYIHGNGTIDACYVNVTLGYKCKQGSVPVTGVDAHTISDVQAAVKFASQHNLRLVIKNTGHDYLGRSTARGSFLLWTHNLKDITYNEGFVPDGAPTGESRSKALTLGAGVQWFEAYNAAETNGRFIVGGLSMGASVGAAGGWIQGGGHSAFSARHGLGVDNVLQFTAVTASGEYLTANAFKNVDLFWALRGGGGGTYAVVTSATYLTHDRVPLTATYVLANFTTPAIAQDVTTEFVKIHPGLADAGWGGYSFISPLGLQLFYIAPNVSLDNANATIQPFVQYVTNATGGPGSNNLQAFVVPFESFYAWYVATYTIGEQVGESLELGSRLIPRETFEKEPAKMAQAMLSVNSGVTINFVAGGAVSKPDPESMGLNPAWRKALGHVLFTENWAEGANITEIQKAKQRVRDYVRILDTLTPESGAYFNEATLYEVNPQKTFFGSHYAKLREIKAKYDPQSLFVVASGVGSEEWDGSLNCRHK
ncbi:hypothetical protein BDZ94DRAFT_1248856 [Collybia nuda]|uniref:FAD-binding PCMH-type domain-containing protein n=1 Tax=Collybia nuda TaxID=64659 RepID=A0A9P5YFH2_9AGAR|nr:hypothetical protein BDZ94DRAFT_1248856 [Collybia nuda]